MKDIRIVSGKKIAPSLDTVMNLLDSKSLDLKKEEVMKLYEKLSFAVQMRLGAKAAFFIDRPKKQEEQTLLYAVFTIGDKVERFAEKYMDEREELRAAIINAMADSCLLEFEKQLLPIIQNMCLEEGYEIKERFKIPKDLPIETQKEAYEKVEAERTLGMSITDGYLFSPVKSMCLVFGLTKDVKKENYIVAEILQGGKKKSLRKKISCPKGTRLLEALQKNNIFLPVYCGGMGACGKCRIRLIKGSLPITKEDRLIFSKKELGKGMRLACKAIVEEDVEILIEKQEENFLAVAEGKEHNKKLDIKQAYQQTEFGIAIDIGTTTLAFSLVNMRGGTVVSFETKVNSQRNYGADVISRIQASNQGKKAELSECIKQDIKSGIKQLTGQNLSAGEKVCHIVIAGNTVMLHLLRGYSCQGFCKYPFTPQTLDLEELEYESVFGIGDSKVQQAKVTLLPGISAFVGADITAGLLACHLPKEGRKALFLDLGTNGEMALCDGNELFVASAAAGPVFEGGAVLWGTGSIPGAISNVKMIQNECNIQTIGEKPPIGICGTGVIEATAELLLSGLVDSGGKLSEPYFKTGYPLAKTPSGERIVFTQKDIREIQMAKSAVRSGIEILMLRMGVYLDEIDSVYLAGGFGYYLDVAKAAEIGILPKEWILRTKAVGNTALSGALSYLANQDKKSLYKITKHAKEISLANDELFQEYYLKNIDFS